MADGEERLDILSMALQQTGVEQSPAIQGRTSNPQANNLFPPALDSLFGQSVVPSFTPESLLVKQEPESACVSTSSVSRQPIAGNEDPLSLACATYLEPTMSIKQESQQQPMYMNSAQTSEPMDFSQSSSINTFNLEDINFDDFMAPPNIPNGQSTVPHYPTTMNESFQNAVSTTNQPNTGNQSFSNPSFPGMAGNSLIPDFSIDDEDLNRLLNEFSSNDPPHYEAPPPPYAPSTGNEYAFPPRYPHKQYPPSSYGVPDRRLMGMNYRAGSIMTPPGAVREMMPQQSRYGMAHRTLGVRRPSHPQVQRFKLSPRRKSPEIPMPVQGEEESDDEEEAFATADTYTNYTPSKLRLGHTHPDPVVESSSLSSVEPPQVWYVLKLPQPVIEERKLSSLQLESIVYACQQHMNILTDGTRAGFLVGDGAGVGKGRTIAGIIYQNYLEGRKKAVWLSVSNDLKFDAVRDLRDVGAKKIEVYSLNKFHYGKISGKRNGRVRKGVIFATYASLIGESSSGGKYRTRFNQLLHWLGSQYEGIIVFDECHKAKNLVPSGAGRPSKTGLTVLELQKKLPKARIVYCSATGASEPKNMAYMSRLGIWGKGTQFPTFQNFIKAVEGRGVGAMEMVAMDMKLRGMYMARQLSFHGVKFSINDVELSPEFIQAYNASVELWIEARRLFQEAADLMDYDKKKNKTMWGQFWASHQRYFKYMCIAAKVPETISHAKKCLAEGKCVVIGLQSTGEARTMEQLEQEDGELTGFVSTIKGVLETLIKRHFPAPSSITDLGWSMFNDDPTLPRSCRKRKRATRPRGQLFQEDDVGSSDSEESSDRGSDSAVESSSEGEGSSGDSGSSTSDSGGSGTEDADDYNPFGGDISEPWLKKDKAKSKKSKVGPPDKKKKRKNFSIKAPPTSRKKGSKTNTGFNSKSLKFEPVSSPKETLAKKPPPSTPPQLAQPPTHSSTPSQDVKPHKTSITPTLGEYRNIVDAMSAKFSVEVMTPGPESSVMVDTIVRKMKEDLLRKLELLAPHLPTNTLDELIDGLGGPRQVAEMTGRRGRVVSLPDGSVQYQLRSEGDVSIELLNIAEKRRFMDGHKNIAIISEAASSGISLQADRRVKNQKLRVHITLELPWSADRAIQQFGRTHRSNQISAPEYIFLISRLSGEQRFASIVAKRLESLGALTHGDRRATESRDLSKYNVDTKYGRQALETTIKSIVGTGNRIVSPEEYSDEFLDQCRTGLVGAGLLNKDKDGPVTADKDSMQMSRFLNRILGLSVSLQNKLFAYFSDTLAAVIKRAKQLGKYDLGIMDFGAAGESVEIVETQEYIGDPAFGTATTQLHRVKVERGMSFSEALNKLNTENMPGEGFYISKRVRSDKQTTVLLKAADSKGKLFCEYRPNTGQSAKTEKMSTILEKYKKASGMEEAEKWWTAQYDTSLTTCNHAFWDGRCKRAIVNGSCEVGLRQLTHHVLSGSILGVWTHVEGVFNRHTSAHAQRMQIVRVRTQQKRLVGILVPNSFVPDMRQTLERVAQQAAAEDSGTADNPIQL